LWRRRVTSQRGASAGLGLLGNGGVTTHPTMTTASTTKPNERNNPVLSPPTRTAAMEAEARPLIEALGLLPVPVSASPLGVAGTLYRPGGLAPGARSNPAAAAGGAPDVSLSSEQFASLLDSGAASGLQARRGGGGGRGSPGRSSMGGRLTAGGGPRRGQRPGARASPPRLTPRRPAAAPLRALSPGHATTFPPTPLPHRQLPEGLDVTVAVLPKDYTHGCDAVGTVPAAIATHLLCTALYRDADADTAPAGEASPPLSSTWGLDLLINAGTCGGFRSEGARIGDVYWCDRAAFHDRRIPLPGFTEYGVGGQALATPRGDGGLEATTGDAAVPHDEAAACGWAAVGARRGVVTTGDSLDWNEDDLRGMRANRAVCKDMEAAAVAWAAGGAGVPVICLKAVTDIVDGDRVPAEEFMENLGRASAAIQAAVPRLLRRIAGRRTDDL